MKKIIFGLALLMCVISVHAQTTVVRAKRVIAKDSMQVGDVWFKPSDVSGWKNGTGGSGIKSVEAGTGLNKENDSTLSADRRVVMFNSDFPDSLEDHAENINELSIKYPLINTDSTIGIAHSVIIATDANYIVKDSDRTIILPSTTALRTITLGTPTEGRRLTIVFKGTASGQWQTDATGFVGDGAVGSPPYSTNGNYGFSSGDHIELVGDGTKWYQIN